MHFATCNLDLRSQYVFSTFVLLTFLSYLLHLFAKYTIYIRLISHLFTMTSFVGMINKPVVLVSDHTNQYQ